MVGCLFLRIGGVDRDGFVYINDVPEGVTVASHAPKIIIRNESNENPVRHRDLCRAALSRVESLTWEKQIERNMTLVQEKLGL
jgi:hypothetical protein